MYERKRTTMKGLFPSALLSLLVMSTLAVDLTLADSASEIDRKATEVLKTLYDTTPGAKVLGAKAKGILIFPKIVKVGFLLGGQMGDGAMRKGGKTTGYYRSVSASFGLQAGVQAFDYVLMFMDDASLNYLERSSGWELGTGPSIVIADKGPVTYNRPIFLKGRFRLSTGILETGRSPRRSWRWSSFWYGICRHVTRSYFGKTTPRQSPSRKVPPNT